MHLGEAARRGREILRKKMGIEETPLWMQKLLREAMEYEEAQAEAQAAQFKGEKDPINE